MKAKKKDLSKNSPFHSSFFRFFCFFRFRERAPRRIHRRGGNFVFFGILLVALAFDAALVVASGAGGAAATPGAGAAPGTGAGATAAVAKGSGAAGTPVRSAARAQMLLAHYVELSELFKTYGAAGSAMGTTHEMEFVEFSGASSSCVIISRGGEVLASRLVTRARFV